MLYHTCTHSMAMMLAAVDVVGGGVCERFPGLTVAFLEGNCSWAPWLLWRLDEWLEMSAAYDHPDLTLAPSAYFRRQCYLSVECDEEPAEMVTRYGLEDRSCSPPTTPTPTPNTPSRWTGSCQCLTDQTKRKFRGIIAPSSTGWSSRFFSAYVQAEVGWVCIEYHRKRAN